MFVVNKTILPDQVIRCSEEGDKCKCVSRRVEQNCRSQCNQRQSQVECIWKCASRTPTTHLDGCAMCLKDKSNPNQCEQICTVFRCNAESTYYCAEGKDCQCVQTLALDKCSSDCARNCSASQQNALVQTNNCQQSCEYECIKKENLIFFDRCAADEVLENLHGLARPKCVKATIYQLCADECGVSKVCSNLIGSDAVVCESKCKKDTCYKREKINLEWLLTLAPNNETIYLSSSGGSDVNSAAVIGPNGQQARKNSCHECHERNFLNGKDANACKAACSGAQRIVATYGALLLSVVVVVVFLQM